MSYYALRPSQSHHLPMRHLQMHVRSWGALAAANAPMVMLHGWMDVGASFQFIVDALSPAFFANRLILAPDLRGFGLTELPAPCDHYVFADYLGDLDALLDYYVLGDTLVDLVGHSMGGLIAMLYAGARPARVRRVINLEGFGLPAVASSKAPQRMTQWLDELRQLRCGAISMKPYPSVDVVADRLIKTNPRLSRDKAQWLAQHWAQPDAANQWHILGDAAHKVVNAQLFRVDEVLAFYAAIQAPVLSVEASDDSITKLWPGQFTLDEYHQRLQHVPNCQTVSLDHCGHMLHHDQPEAVAQLIESFTSLR